MSRRFLNLVLRCNGDLYTVNQLDTSNLFYKSSTAAAAARKKNGCKQTEEEILELQRLPASNFSFQPFRSNFYEIIRGADLFAPFGKEGMILCCDGVGQTAIYDPRLHSVRNMPMMNAPKGPMSIIFPLDRTEAHATSAAACDPNSNINRESFIYNWIEGEHSESLYIMDIAPRSPFPFEWLSFSSKGWVWRALPLPPFLHGSGYKARQDSCAAANGNMIFLSPSTQDEVIGTYRFDTVTHEWCKAGDWVLPFLGKAEFFPELGHWFGLSHCSPYHICAVSSLDPPEVKHSWSDLDPPEGWSLVDLCLVNLGSGRFCSAKFFDIRDPSYEAVINIVAVFTGVEVVRCANQDGGIGLEMLKHKSKCVTNVDLKCVL